MGFRHTFGRPDRHAGYFDARFDQENAPRDIYAHYSACFDARQVLVSSPLALSDEGSLDSRRLRLATINTGYITVYRISSREYFYVKDEFPRNWEDSDRKRSAHQRYSPAGTVGHYVGLTFDAAMDECLYYGDGKVDASKNLLVAIECYFDGLLHLGNAKVLESVLRTVGEPIADDGDDLMMKLLDPQTTNPLTDKIGLWARAEGFNGIIYPTARYSQRQDVAAASRHGSRIYPVINHVALGIPLDSVLSVDTTIHLLTHQAAGGSLAEWTPMYADLNLVLFSGEQLTGKDRGVFYQALPLELSELLIREDSRPTTESSHLYAGADGRLKPKLKARTAGQQRIPSLLERSNRNNLAEFQILRPGKQAHVSQEHAEEFPDNVEIPWEASLAQAAATLRERGDYRLSEDAFLSIVQSLDEAKRNVHLPFIREMLVLIGLSWWRRGNLRPAEELIRFLINHSPVTHELLNNLGLIYSDEGRFEESEQTLRRAVAMCEEEVGKEHALYITTLCNYGIALEKLGRVRESIGVHEHTLQTAERALPDGDVQFTRILNNLAMSYLTLGRVRKAGELFKRALALTENAYGPDHVETAISHHNLAKWCERRHLLKEAEEHYESAVGTKMRVVPDSPSLATSLSALGSLLYRSKRFKEALPMAEEAYELHLRTFGPVHASTRSSQLLRALIKSSLGAA